MGVISYVARRLLLATFVLFSVSLITFVISKNISTNPVTAWLGRAAGQYPELAEIYIKKFHLDEPVHIQYWYYLVGLLQGDLGWSPSRNEPVLTAIARSLPYTLQIVFLAILITLTLGIPLGLLSGRSPNRKPDHAIRAFYLAGISSPPFFVALVLLMVFTYTLRLLPGGGVISPNLVPPRPLTGFILLDSIFSGSWNTILDVLTRMIMPSLALALGNFGYVTRVLRSSLLDVLQTNYIRTARAKGLDERTVFLKHALRNSLIPVITVVALIFGWLMASTPFVEAIFAYPGIGQYAVTALQSLDYPAILGITLTLTVTIVLANLLADILYAVVNPEIRL